MKKRKQTKASPALKIRVLNNIRGACGGAERREIDAELDPIATDRDRVFDQRMLDIDAALVELRDEGAIACTNGVWWARTARTARV